ncbi:hypothetical protein BG844_07990 [Couchioplanes caeruleus subsp. caeruleus]|uniref:Uncharacterized protein n=1 Tax=Couchioplanes caeruleus subsp. caeruleus TaxID=56427 RepID=A0A1K0FPX1_9ACTN|nr:hypothetical protein BG844_07990 [Couchioplanes caeruleus subsp. caeruleus]
MPIDLGLAGGVSVADGVADSVEVTDQLSDLRTTQSTGRDRRGCDRPPRQGRGALGINRSDPTGHGDRIAAGLGERAIASQLGVTFRDDRCRVVLWNRRSRVLGLSGVQAVDGVRQSVRGKGSQQPPVQLWDQVLLG